eukprot:gb/GECG01008788.1/.p1 GENE.gb/GECG01008788.1/~~gb/GECG01008788.1/.p1  ORF type:complete len:486 (+),score=28.47 gb/GECG01008788.1/:1-1458(+)
MAEPDATELLVDHGTHTSNYGTEGTNHTVEPMNLEQSETDTPSCLGDLRMNIKRRKAPTNFVAVANFTNAIIGSGILGLPMAMRECGLVLGLGLLTLIALLSNYTLKLLFGLMVSHKQNSFHDLAGKAFTSRGRYLVLTFEMLFSVSAMLTYWIIIRDVLKSMVGTSHSAATEPALILFLCSIPVLALFYKKDFGGLWPYSLTSLIFVGFFTIFVIVKWSKAQSLDDADSRYVSIGDRFPSSVGPITFAFVCHHQASLVHLSMGKRRPSPDILQLKFVANWSLGIAFVFSVIVSTFGHFLFSDSVGDFIANFKEKRSHLITFGQVSVLANMIFTLPSEQMVARNAILKCLKLKRLDDIRKASTMQEIFKEDYEQLVDRRFLEQYKDRRRRIERYIVSTVLWLVPVGVALVIPEVDHVLELAGGIAGSFLAFIGPPLIKVRLGDNREDEQLWTSPSNMAHILLACFGIIIFFVSSAFTIVAISRGE